MAEVTFLRVPWSALAPKPRLGAIGALFWTVSCAAAPPVPPSTPPIAAKAEATVEGPPPSAPFESPLPPLSAFVPRAPTECTAYTAHVPSCEGSWLSELEQALGIADALERDVRLARIESCSESDPGWVRALRAELGESVCADVLVEQYYSSETGAAGAATPGPAVESALLGLALAARLDRLNSPPPLPPEPNTRAAFQDYLKRELQPWIANRASAIFELSNRGARLEGYGRGVVAVQAAIADLRFVAMARDVPLPQEMRIDSAVSNEYFGALDMALEPRKERGRDAALAGLAAFADLGVLNSPRITRAREVLSTSYAGHRIDALDGLRLPALSPPDSSTVEMRLARTLPTFFAERVFAAADPTSPALLRALLERGLYPSARKRLDAGPLSFEAAELYARGLVALGQRYWRSPNFRRAAEVASIVPAAGQTVSEHAKLLQALAVALQAGPVDARAMMLGGPLLPKGVGEVTLLDELAKGKGEAAAIAAYDAAYVLSFLPPTQKVKEFWQGIAQRYERAATLTGDAEFKKDATTRAKAARETAKAVKE
jgi:hypothetical protein